MFATRSLQYTASGPVQIQPTLVVKVSSLSGKTTSYAPECAVLPSLPTTNDVYSNTRLRYYHFYPNTSLYTHALAPNFSGSDCMDSGLRRGYFAARSYHPGGGTSLP